MLLNSQMQLGNLTCLLQQCMRETPQVTAELLAKKSLDACRCLPGASFGELQRASSLAVTRLSVNTAGASTLRELARCCAAAISAPCTSGDTCQHEVSLLVILAHLLRLPMEGKGFFHRKRCLC